MKYKTDAENGDAESQLIFGTCYATGDGVEQDYRKAVHWFRKAAMQEHMQAFYNLGVCNQHGYGMPQNHMTALSWLEKAAQHGHKEAQAILKDDLLLKKG